MHAGLFFAPCSSAGCVLVVADTEKAAYSSAPCSVLAGQGGELLGASQTATNTALSPRDYWCFIIVWAYLLPHTHMQLQVVESLLGFTHVEQIENIMWPTFASSVLPGL